MNLYRNDSGSVVVYGALVGALVIGSGALALDIGRMTVLQSQMQDRADAGAMAAAVQLDGRAGARARAQAVAMDAINQSSGIPSDGSSLVVSSVNFYSELEPAAVAATGDEDSAFVEVVLTPRQVNFLFKPLLDRFPGGGGDSGNINATAAARPDPFICHAPPLMVCDLVELDVTLDLRSPSNAGKQIRLKAPQSGGSGAWAPGNFGLLSLPDGSSGAAAIAAALAAVEPEGCYDTNVATATGSRTNQIKDAVNARFNVGVWSDPAPNVINYGRDPDIDADPDVVLGSGNWDIDGYWAAKHGGGTTPVALAGASRYQVYLYEQGLEFARNGKETIYPIDGALSDGFDVVTPPAADVPVAADPAQADNPDFDGVPSLPAAANGQARRLVQVAQLRCIAEGVNGHGTYPSNGNYVEMFITEIVRDPPDAAIYAEIVRALSPASSPDFHANVRLVK